MNNHAGLLSSELNEVIHKSLDFRGKTPLKIGMEWGGGEILALSANNVVMGGIDKNREAYYGGELLYSKWMNKGDCEQGDILLTMEAPLGNVAQIPDGKKYILSQRVILLKPKRDIILPNYLFYFIMGSEFQRDLIKNSTGSTVTGIQQKKLNKIHICYPSLSKQQKIAKILTTIDQLIDKTQAIMDKQIAIKQGMMADLFTRGIDLSTGQLRPPVEQAPELYKETELGWVPREWGSGKLGRYISKIEQGWSPDCMHEAASPGVWGVLKTTAVVWDGFVGLENKMLPLSMKPRKEYEVFSGDVLMTRAGPGARVGVVAYVESVQDKLMLSDKLYRIRPNEQIEPSYLSLLLSSDQIQSQLNCTKTGLAESQSNISQEIVKKLNIFVPEVGEQKEIGKRLNSIEAKKAALKTEVSKYKSVKTGLMQDLLTGKVAV